MEKWCTNLGFYRLREFTLGSDRGWVVHTGMVKCLLGIVLFSFLVVSSESVCVGDGGDTVRGRGVIVSWVR